MAKDIKKEIQAKTAPRKGSAKDVAAARAKGKALLKKQDAKATESATRLSTRIEKQAKRASTKGTPEKVARASSRASRAVSDLTRGKYTPSKTALAKAKAQVIKKDAPTGRGRKADPNSARQKLLAERAAKAKAGTLKRGRPKSAATIEREKAMAEHRAKRAAEGKSSRGRKASATSRRSQQTARKVEKKKELAKPMEHRSATLESKKGSRGMKPSEAMAKYSSMKQVPQENPMFEERGLHKRGKTTVTYGAGGQHKFRRRTVQLKGAKGGKATISVLQNLRKGDGEDRYKPFHSFRSMHSKDAKVEESLTHHRDPAKARKIRFTKTRSAAGIESEKMETRTGRRSMSAAAYGKRGKVSAKAKRNPVYPGVTGASGTPHGNPQKIAAEGRSALRNTHSMSREGTQHKPFDRPAAAAPEPKLTMRKEFAKVGGNKTAIRRKK